MRNDFWFFFLNVTFRWFGKRKNEEEENHCPAPFFLLTPDTVRGGCWDFNLICLQVNRLHSGLGLEAHAALPG